MKNRLSIKMCQKNLWTEKKYDELGKYSSISYLQESQEAGLFQLTSFLPINFNAMEYTILCYTRRNIVIPIEYTLYFWIYPEADVQRCS